MDSENADKKASNAAPQGGPSIPQIEEEMTKFWEENGIFEKSLEKTKDGRPYTFYDGPPFATGLPHYGHILASTIKDLIPRYQTMRGRFVRRRWGWDCHGLPIEALVEKKLEISGKKQIEEVGIQTFNETCRSMVLQYVEEWGKMVRRMGRWVDFENSYKTMDQEYMESVWWAFKQVYDKDLAYEGRKVLLYCPRCETPISNFEVAMDNSYKNVNEESVYVKFKAKGTGGEDPAQKNLFLLAWTTTPWTLPGNVALAVGSDVDYVKAKVGEEVFVVAKALAEKVLPAGYEIVSEMKGADLVGMSYEPLFSVPAVAESEKSFKVYAADFVTTEDGTGIVHTAVVYGEDDYKLGLREGLPVVPLLDEKGHFNDQSPELVRGQYFKKSEKAVKDDLEARSLLLKRESFVHSYPHCWRCSTALFYNAIPAWFINIQKIKPDLLKSNEKEVNWFPDHLKHGRYQKSVEAAPDWNISRNRYWGNPIPVWKCEACAKVTVAGSINDLAAKNYWKNKFYFLRHTEAEHITKHIAAGGPEEGDRISRLTPEGLNEAKRIAASLTGRKFAAIYTSPYIRSKALADLVGEATGAPVIVEPRLGEVDHGVLNWKSIEEHRAFFKDRFEKFTKAPEGGETLRDVRKRAMQAVKEINQKHRGEDILLVSHGDPIWVLDTAMRGLPDADMYSALKYPELGELREAVFTNLSSNAAGYPDMHRPYIDEVELRCDCGGRMRRTPEIFDSWVEAGSMPFSEYHYPFENKQVFESRFPAQFVAEYIAQTRAWFYVMHVMSQILFGKAPFENVVTTGNILAEDGSKMSKSKNNYPDPWLVIDKYGVDTLRFYLMNSVVMEADNVDFSVKDLESIHRKVTMILWNVQQYFMTYSGAAGERTESEGSVTAAAETHVLDRWILARTKELVAGVTDHLDAYNTVRATRVITSYIDDLSTWYLRRSRGREDAGFFPNFRQALAVLSQILAPVMPHVAEAVYRNVRTANDPESVHLTDWPAKERLSPEEKNLLEEMAIVREAASWGLMFRKGENIPVRQPLARMVMLIEGDKKLSEELLDILLSELNVKTIDQSIAGSEESSMRKVEAKPPIKAIYIDTNITEELKLEGEVRKLERAIQEKRKEMGLKMGEMARLIYSAEDPEKEAVFKKVDMKKTYLSEIKKVENDPAAEFTLELTG